MIDRECDLPIESVLARLDGVCETSPGQHEALCPCHDDRSTSLSIGSGHNGRALIHCHAGCDTPTIVASIGLTMADLMPKTNGKAPTSRIIKEYDYRDADGIVVFQVVRFDPKDFRQRRPNPDGGWTWDLKGVERVLYRSPELIAADPKLPVFFCEGEKDVDRLISLRLVATTNAGGANKWQKQYVESLIGRHVVVLPDNDSAGRTHAAKIAAELSGVAASVRVLELPGLPEKGDVSDWLDAGGTADTLNELAGAEEPWAPSNKTQICQAESAPIGASKKTPTREPVLRRLSEVEPQEVEWLWPDRIAIGRLTILAGDPGLGKSFLTCSIAAIVSKGGAWPDAADIPIPVGGVVFLTAEDDLADTVRPRLDAHGADVSKVTAIESIRSMDPSTGQEVFETFNLQRDIPNLEKAIQQTPKCRLVIIDPISAYCGKTDSHNNTEVRGLLAPLSELAARHGVAVVGVTHLNKNSGGPAIYRAMGSLAFAAAARAVWCVTKDQDKPSRRLLLPVKNNLALDSGGLAFSLEPLGPDESPVVCWEDGIVDVTADDAMSAEQNENSGAVGEAVEWLRQHLSEGAVHAKEVKDAAKADGIACRTLERAKAELGVEAEKEGYGGPWIWRLPNCADAAPFLETGALGDKLAPLGEERQDGRKNANAAPFPDDGALGHDLAAFGEERQDGRKDAKHEGQGR